MNDDELDIDGDGVADVVVPGLPPGVEPPVESADSSDVTAVVTAVMPPDTHPYSPMGQIEHRGYALQSQTARTGWRRPVIKAFAVLTLLVIVGGLIASLVVR